MTGTLCPVVKGINCRARDLPHAAPAMRPFVDTPFFVANPLQANALARLRHAVTYPGGVAVLTGGPGVGKSAFVRQALATVDSDVQLLPVDLRSADPAELNGALLQGLGATSAESAARPSSVRLREALLAQRTSGRQLILSLDVSGLNVELARRLLRFVSINGEQETPVSLILQGPHDLHQLLDVPALIQLRQRLSFRLKVRPLTLIETAGYLRHCLTASGVNANELLTVNAPASVYLYVAGVPRLVNTLMDATLGEARARQAKRIDAELIRQVAEQLGWKPIGSLGPVDLASVAAAPATDAPAATTPPAERRAPPVPMDNIDTGATGMLRLEDLDERFAETLFSEDSGHFRTLVEAGKTD